MYEKLKNIDLNIKTVRLILEPVAQSHAHEMLTLLSDSDLYSYIPSNPPNLIDLQAQYKRWEPRISPSGDELWLNWIGRMASTGSVCGHFQAGLKSNGEANIAYLVGISFQKMGIAYEAMNAVNEFLFCKLNSCSVKAWLDTRNKASISLVKKLGMVQSQFIEKADYFKGTDSDEYVFEINAASFIKRSSP